MTYIPAPNLDFSSWLDNFVDELAADPDEFGFSAAEVSTLSSLRDDYNAKLALTENPNTRTSPNIEARKSSREVVEAMARVFAQRIQSNPSTTNEQRETLGLNVPTGHAPPVTPTSTPPEVIAMNIAGQMQIHYQNPDTPTTKAKPHGAQALQVVMGIRDSLDQPAPTPQESNLLGTITSTPVTINMDSWNLAGKHTVVYGRWIYSQGNASPWSTSTSQSWP